MRTCVDGVLFSTKVMRIISPLMALFIAHSTWAVGATWISSHGGDMQLETNWDNGVKPTSSDSIKITRSNDKPITLSEDLTATGGNSSFASNFELALTNSVGEARTLSLSTFYAGGGLKTVSLTAGTLAFSGSLYMGDMSTSYTNDTFIVDGANTAFSGGTIYVGTKCPNSTFIVQNGATVTGSRLYVGRNQFNESSPSTNSCFRVTGAGSTATFSYENQSSTDSGVFFGGNGFCRIEVLDGGCLSVTNLAVRRNSYATIPWYGDNSVLVSGSGSKVVINGAGNKGFWLGNATAPGCSVTVEDGASWESRGEFKIADGYVTNATFRVASGASVKHYIYAVNVGTSDNAKNAALEIDNGVVECLNNVIYVKGEGSHISISGANARLSSPNGDTKFFAGTRLEVEIPAGGFTGGEPPISSKTFSLDAGAAVNVTLDEEWNNVALGNYRVVIAETENDIKETGFTVNLPADTDNLVVTRDTTNVKQFAVNVKVKGGMVILLK